MQTSHQFIDLGLSSGTKWATCNIGAESPENHGDYFAWGEVFTKNSYSVRQYRVPGLSSNLPADKQYDAAQYHWGENCRIPNKEDFKELINECDFIWTTKNGVQGYEITGKNGNSIFLPVTGFKIDRTSMYKNVMGFYWSSSICDSASIYDSRRAFSFKIRSGGIPSRNEVMDRYCGLCIRPVIKLGNE